MNIVSIRLDVLKYEKNFQRYRMVLCIILDFDLRTLFMT